MTSIEVLNFDKEISSEKRVVAMFPNIMRAGILGPSGCGKTNVLLTILLHKKPMQNIYLCSKSVDQDKYQILGDLVDKHNKSTAGKKISFYEIVDVEKLPPPEKVPENSLIIFDDILTEQQDKIATYFMRGRHRKLSCFYLAQSYTKIPKKSGIRENFNFLILFKQDNVNLRQIFNEYGVAHDFKKFKQISQKCWSEPFSFLTIDMEGGQHTFRKQFQVSSII